jgi:hypothetical protein
MAFCNAKWEYDEGGIEGRLSVGSKGIQRRGYYEKELFPGAGSLGRSTPYWSSPYLFALAWQHNIGNHNISLSGTLEGRTPQSSATFLQEEYNNRLVNNLTLGTNLAFDFSYNYRIYDVSIPASEYDNFYNAAVAYYGLDKNPKYSSYTWGKLVTYLKLISTHENAKDVIALYEFLDNFKWSEQHSLFQNKTPVHDDGA